MTPETLFQIANPLAMAGWLLLVLSPLAPRFALPVAGFVLPAVLAAGYAALILAFWWSAEGGFDSLPNVMLLFDNPQIALAGWVHFLAFDLFVGGWEVRTARREGIAHLLVVPCLVLTFLFGPVGLLLFLAIRLIRSRGAARPYEA